VTFATAGVFLSVKNAVGALCGGGMGVPAAAGITIGVDAHNRVHAAVAIDSQGQVLTEWRGPNTPEGWRHWKRPPASGCATGSIVGKRGSSTRSRNASR
jgi:hypothetical protein